MGLLALAQAAIGTITHVARSIVPSLMAWNQSRALTTQSKSLELAEKRDAASQKAIYDRMEFDGKLELYRQAIRAKEREEDRAFSLSLEHIRAENLLKTEEMRQAFQALEADKQRKFTEAIEKFKAEIQVAINNDSLAFYRWKEETGRQFAIEMKWLDVRINRILSKEVREDGRRDRNSPIFAVTDDILALVTTYDQPPLSIFISPPVLRFDPNPKGGGDPQFPMMESTLNAALRDLFQKYSQNQRPTMLHAGEWVTNARRAESAARDLFRSLRTAPVVIIETEVEESFLNLNIGSWSGNTLDIRFDTVVRKFRWRDGLDEIRSQRAAEFAQTNGISIYQAPPSEQEKLTRKSREDLTHYIEVLHCIHAGMIADEYFLIHAEPRQLPLLPKLLPDLLAEESLPPEAQAAFRQQVIDYCSQLFDALGQIEPLLVADLRLAWAQQLRELPAGYGFTAQLIAAMQHWLSLRGEKATSTDLGELCGVISQYLVPEDSKFVDAVNVCLTSLGTEPRLNIATACYQRGLQHLDVRRFDLAELDFTRTLAVSPHKDAYYQRARAHAGLGDWPNAIADLNKAIELQPNRGEAHELRGDAYAKQQNIEIALANYAEAVKYGATTAQRKRDELQAHWTQERRQAAEAEAKRQREAAERQRKAHDYFNGGVYHLERENFDQALADFAQAQQYGHPEAGQRLAETQQAKQRKSLSIPIPGTNLTLELVQIPAGSFQMGGTQNSYEQPVHTVHLQAYRMSKYQVTQKLYQAVMGSNPAYFKGDDLPVERVSWDDAKAFCQKLSEKIGQEVRLPSEAEWEYACRAGSTGEYGFGNDPKQLGNYAWYEGNAGGQTHPVGQKQANDWGLYDMHGNVWEWCEDVWHDSYNGAPTDGSAWVAGGESNRRVQRGGSWYRYAYYCRSAFRLRDFADFRTTSTVFGLSCLPRENSLSLYTFSLLPSTLLSLFPWRAAPFFIF